MGICAARGCQVHLHASSKLIAPLQPCADTTASLLPAHSSCLSNSTTHSWCQSVVRGMSSILICVTPGATVRHSLHFTKGFHVKQCAVMPCLFKSRHLEQQLLLSRMLRFGIDAAWDAERYTSVPFQAGRLWLPPGRPTSSNTTNPGSTVTPLRCTRRRTCQQHSRHPQQLITYGTACSSVSSAAGVTLVLL
jgi:hypothetical protein